MSKLKLTACILLASLASIGSVNAAEDNKEKPKASASKETKSEKSKTSTGKEKDTKAENSQKDNQKSSKKEDKKENKSSTASSLKEFSNAIGITYTGGELGKDAQGQQYFVLGYTIENKSKNSMKSVHWTTAFVNNQQPIFAKNIDVPFPAPLKSKEKISVNIQIAFSEMSQEAVKMLLDTKQKSDIVVIAREINYTNGKKITVQQ